MWSSSIMISWEIFSRCLLINPDVSSVSRILSLNDLLVMDQAVESSVQAEVISPSTLPLRAELAFLALLDSSTFLSLCLIQDWGLLLVRSAWWIPG